MSRGWYQEPFRHSLASKGVKTTHDVLRDRIESKIGVKPPRELINIDYDYISNYFGNDKEEWTPIDEKIHFKNIQRIVYLFWWSHINDNWDYFEFDKVFDTLQSYFRGFIKNEEKLVSDYLDEDIDAFKNGEINPDGILRISEVHNIENHADAYELVNEYKPTMSKSEKINLFDELVDMEHTRGNILFLRVGATIENLREDFEYKYLGGEKPTLNLKGENK